MIKVFAHTSRLIMLVGNFFMSEIDFLPYNIISIYVSNQKC